MLPRFWCPPRNSLAVVVALFPRVFSRGSSIFRDTFASITTTRTLLIPAWNEKLIGQQFDFLLSKLRLTRVYHATHVSTRWYVHYRSRVFAHIAEICVTDDPPWDCFGKYFYVCLRLYETQKCFILSRKQRFHIYFSLYFWIFHSASSLRIS